MCIESTTGQVRPSQSNVSVLVIRSPTWFSRPTGFQPEDDPSGPRFSHFDVYRAYTALGAKEHQTGPADSVEPRLPNPGRRNV